MTHVPMCKLCGEYEVGTFQSHRDFCSDGCADKALEYIWDAAGEVEYLYEWEDPEAIAAAAADWQRPIAPEDEWMAQFDTSEGPI